MSGQDDLTRTKFALWVGDRLRGHGITEAAAGRRIGRKPGWLGRFVRRRHANDELTFLEAKALVELLGGDLDIIAPHLLEGTDPIDPVRTNEP